MRIRSERRLASRNRPYDEKRLCSGRDRIGQQCVRRLVRKIFLASEEAQERPALQGNVIADGPPQHGIASLKHVQRRAQCDRASDLDDHFGTNMRKRSQMLW